jgi:hypothetical protein
MASSSATTNNSQTAYICRSCDATSATTVNPPHPVYTNGAGKDIYQLDMVVIGGDKGLNS